MRILVIDDDVELADLLQTFLRREGFQPEFVHDGRAGLQRTLEGSYDLIVLDVMLPGMDGFEILRRIREQSRVPVIMLTARGDEPDRIVGLENGADDYVPKPFNPRELAARIRAIQRRVQPAEPARRLEANGVTLDPASREVRCDGKLIDLTTIEFDILEQLMRFAGRVLSRDALMEALYNRKATPYDRSMDMHISHLRKKLECGDVTLSRQSGALATSSPSRERKRRIETEHRLHKDAALVFRNSYPHDHRYGDRHGLELQQR